MRAGMSKSHDGSYTNETWLTPPPILAALGQFDLDPCAAPSPRPWPTATNHIELPRNGLTEKWLGRVWLNPPYGTEAARWLDRLATHGNGIALIFARTETAMFHQHVWRRAHAILFLEGRITFCDRHGKPAAANGGAPSCLVAYGNSNAHALARCGLPGAFVRLDPSALPPRTLFEAVA